LGGKEPQRLVNSISGGRRGNLGKKKKGGGDVSSKRANREGRIPIQSGKKNVGL